MRQPVASAPSPMCADALVASFLPPEFWALPPPFLCVATVVLEAWRALAVVACPLAVVLSALDSRWTVGANPLV